MKKTLIVACFVLAAVALSWAEENRAGVTVKLRFMEGIRESVEQKPQIAVATSSYLQPVFSGALAARADLEDERKQIARVFNLKDVRLITEADFPVALPKKPGDEGILHLIRLNGREYTVRLMPTGKPLIEQLEFRLEIFERAENKKTNLLDTEFRMTSGGIAVFGFETSGGAPYFLSFRLEGDIPGAVRVIGRIQPPKLIRQVEPVYPDVAREARVDGIVILEATTDIYGRVQNVKILRSIPLLDQAAVDAVRQWIYEPMIIEGEPRPVTFTVTVRFQLPDKEQQGKPAAKTGGVFGGVMGGVMPADFANPVKAVGDIKPPKLVSIVDPVYPPEAKEKGIEGVVILEVMTDIHGKVAKMRILRSIPELDQAAEDAVLQWEYAPLIIDGKPRPVLFTVTVRFQLK